MNTNSKNVCNFVKNRKKNLISLFNSQCCLCGFQEFQEALDFHHVNPQTKQISLSANHMIALDKQIDEARKCILVCANCHRGIHAGYYQVPKDYQKFFNEEQAQYLLEMNHKVKQGKIHYCQNCGKILTNKTKYCSKCRFLIQRVVTNRPNRNELKKLVREKSFLAIGREYNVSDNTIRKWCLIENLPTRKRYIKSLSDEDWEQI